MTRSAPAAFVATGAVRVSARNKPSSVPLSGGGSFIWDRCYQRPRAAYPGLEWNGPFHRPLFGLAPGGVYQAASVTSDPVRSYRTISPLPVPRTAIGGVFSAALSVVSRRPGVTRHPVLWSSDFPPTDESDGDPHSPRSSGRSPQAPRLCQSQPSRQPCRRTLPSRRRLHGAVSSRP